LYSQSTGKTDSVYTLRLYEDLVMVDVVVTGKDGTPIKNLRQEDFRIFEDKTPQQIRTFDFEDLSQAIDAIPKPTESIPLINLSQTSPTQLPKGVLQNRRLMILMLDLSAMPAEDQIQAQQAAQSFIEKKMTPADLVAIVSNSSNLKLLQNFTNDRSALLEAVHKFIPGESSSLAGLGTTDPDAADASMEDQSNPFVADETQFNIFNTDRKLSAVESVAKLFAGFPEKKFLVHFSSGIETTGTENQSQLRSTVNALNQANTSLYTVDARGLIAAPPGGDASQGSASGNANYSGRAVRNQMASISGSQETLTTLALDTGGKALLDSNDLGQVFEAVRRDSSSYYLLGYYSSNSKRDGKFRQIKVQVTLPGARLKHRPGYFAPKSFEQFSQSDKERQLEEAVSSERPFSEVPFLVAANFIKADAVRVFVPIGLNFSTVDIFFQQKGKMVQAEFDFAGQVRGPQNSVVSAVRDTIRVRLDPETPQNRRRAMQYTTGFYLKPGLYSLKFLLRENQTGKLSTFEQPLSVPDYGGRKLSMSSIILSARLEPQTQQDKAIQKLGGSAGAMPGASKLPDPLVVEQKRIVPSVTRVFSRGETLYIFFQTYLPHHKGAPHMTQSLAFYREGQLFQRSAPVELAEFDEDSPDTVTSNVSTPLSSFPKGQYVLQVSTTEAGSGASLSEKVFFVVQ
jgi:VWFA-related protein